MTKDEFRPLFKRLTVSLPPRAKTREELQDLFDVYYDALKGLAADQFERAVMHCQNECEKFPTIAEIKRHAGEGGGGQVPNATAYNQADLERTMMAPIHFLEEYDYCPHDCHPCDGTMGGKVPKGCCGWERWHIYRSLRWLQKHGRPIPKPLVAWMDKRGLLGRGQLTDIPDLGGDPVDSNP